MSELPWQQQMSSYNSGRNIGSLRQLNGTHRMVRAGDLSDFERGG